ncbi:MAG TPA: hypothetical protein PKL77_07310 [Candidatus Omnitrophota bacterium]|nr:hypothetical protein [Candidatus Omnitrophota bacterium]
MTIQYDGKGRDIWTILFDDKGRWLCAIAGKHSLKRMINHWSGAKHII